jgi:hypothetical protein
MRYLFVLLSATAVAAPVDPAAIARHHAAGLGEPEVVPAGDGWAARFRQTHAGLPVIGGDLVVRIDQAGQVLRRRGQIFDLRGFPVTPTVSAAHAVDLIRQAARHELAAAPRLAPLGSPIAYSLSTGEVKTQLAIDPAAAGGPRLVWAVRGTPMPQLLENAVYLVDATSGALLKRIDLLKYGKANVFLQNPIETPQPAARDFPADFEPTNIDGYLEGALLKAYDCLDNGDIRDVNLGPGLSFTVHICTVTPSAKAADHDYTIYQPETEPLTAPANGCPAAPAGGSPQPLDEFSEQHMYWHVADVYSFFRGLFAESNRPDWKLRAQPLAMAVNLCTPNFSGGLGANLTGPLVPFDNAFFSPGRGNVIAETLIMGQDSIMFGQGSKYDFAYDADVIKHEFTHAVIDTLGKLVQGGAEDGWGLQDDQAAMNEGLADYFSSVIGGDPTLGEYAGRNISGGSAEGAVRDLTIGDLCGRDRWGEPHQDSQAFSAALWGARVAIAGDPKSAAFDAVLARKFDRAVLVALSTFAGNVDMTTAATDIASEAKTLLGADAKTKVEAAFTAHQILPECDRVIDWMPGDHKPLLGLDGTDSPYAPSGATRVPGFVQWKIDVPAGADSITAKLTLMQSGGSFSGTGSFFGGGSKPKLELIVGPPGEPVAWVPKTNGGNESQTAAFSGDTGAVTATLSGLGAGLNYVMIVNSGGGAIAQNITFETSCSTPGACGPDMAMAASSEGGCKCSFGGRAALPAPLLLLPFALLIRRRRAR